MRAVMTISSSEATVQVNGRLARIIAYLVANNAALDVDGTSSGKLLILWGEDWLCCRKEQDLPPIREQQADGA